MYYTPTMYDILHIYVYMREILGIRWVTFLVLNLKYTQNMCGIHTERERERNVRDITLTANSQQQ